ncbi:MAG: hypothetical protein R3C05_30045 [Pirellulaceae bacterium]
MRIIQIAIALTTVLLLSGCGVMRGIEQWKCDTWGMCHFGIRPSAAAPPCSGPTCGLGAPCAGNGPPLPTFRGNDAPCCGDANAGPAASYLLSPTPAG